MFFEVFSWFALMLFVRYGMALGDLTSLYRYRPCMIRGLFVKKIWTVHIRAAHENRGDDRKES